MPGWPALTGVDRPGALAQQTSRTVVKRCLDLGRHSQGNLLGALCSYIQAHRAVQCGMGLSRQTGICKKLECTLAGAKNPQIAQRVRGELAQVGQVLSIAMTHEYGGRPGIDRRSR